MAFPKIATPEFTVEIPFIGKKLKARPMLVKEEKILLMAKQAESKKEQVEAVKQILNACVLEKNFKADDITFFELEYLFLKIRAQSISNKAKASYQDAEEDKPREFEVDLNKVKVLEPKNFDKTIKLFDDMVITMKMPSVALMTSEEVENLVGEDFVFHLIVKCIDKVHNANESFDASTMAKEEIEEFVNSLPAKYYEKFKEFFNNQPSLEYKIGYKNDKGTERLITLSGLDDFFIFV